MPHLLVIEDDADVRRLIDVYARAMGWTVSTAPDAGTGLQAFQDIPVDVVVLDLLLPDASGYDVLRTIRASSDVYVILLTALGSEAERMQGLGQGADDYLVKPFSPGELMARCQALLRRPRRRSDHSGTDPGPGRLVIDRERFEVLWDGRRVLLTALEFRLLDALARHPGRVFTREQLVRDALGVDYAGYDRVIDVHIGHVRRKLGDDPAAPQVIETVRGVGYRFRAEPPE